MIYNATEPNEFLAEIEDDWRKAKLLEVRNIILDQEPALKEGMDYRMLAYGDEDRKLFHLTAQSGHVSLYVGDIRKIDPSAKLLEGFNTGKGCIRIRKTQDVNQPNFKAFVAKAIELWKAGHDLSC